MVVFIWEKDLKIPKIRICDRPVINMYSVQYQINRAKRLVMCRNRNKKIYLFFPGNYSCLVAQFYLSRSVGFHLVQSYLPTMLIVVISWVSFWMDVDSVPGRTTLGVTTLLAVGSQSSGTSQYTF